MNTNLNSNQDAGTIAASLRKTAIAAGLLYLITHVTSVGSAVLYGSVLNDAGYIIGSGADMQVLLGAFAEVILALAVVGTSVALFPVVKRQNEGVALGYVGLRTLEAGIIAVGVLPLLAAVTLRQQLVGTAGSDAATLATLGNALVALHNWTLVLGPGFVCGTNTVLMAYLMYKSRLVPRFIPVLGLVGGPLVFAYHTVQMFGMDGQVSRWAGVPVAAVAVIPIFAWELSLAIWLIVKGFNRSAMAFEPAQTATNELVNVA
jgi:hypothetical protein